MSKRLAPYGNQDYAGSFATVGTVIKAPRLAESVPSRELLTKVGVAKAPLARTHRLVRRNATTG